MKHLLNFSHIWLVFVTSLRLLHYKSAIRQQILFTAAYGMGTVFSRYIYKFFKVPFGTHTMLLIILSIILFKIIFKDFSWRKSMYITLVTFIILLIAEAATVLPIMKLFDLTVNEIETDKVLNIYMGILLNLVLILMYIILVIRDLSIRQRGPNRYHSRISHQQPKI